MKKFLAILFVLMMIPLYTFAANSPTAYKMVTSDPKITQIPADQTAGWDDILERLKDVEDETNGYIMIDAFAIMVDKQYKNVEWQLSIPVITEHEPFALIIDSEAIVKQEISTTEDGKVVVDFSEVDIGMYYICFYIKALE